jgi:hypothetical protein
METGTETSRRSYVWEAEERTRKTYTRLSEGKSLNKWSELPAGYEELLTGHCGRFGPLRSGKKETKENFA